MRNWLGQEILPGSVVFRGARQGNSSEYKIGVVKAVTDTKARVDWKYESTALQLFIERGRYANGRPYGEWEFLAYVPYEIQGAGSPSFESLIVVSEELLERCHRANQLRFEFNDRDDMTKEEFLDRLKKLW